MLNPNVPTFVNRELQNQACFQKYTFKIGFDFKPNISSSFALYPGIDEEVSCYFLSNSIPRLAKFESNIDLKDLKPFL